MEQEKLKDNIDWALYYLSLGWNPIPVNRKIPLIEWKRYQTEKVTKELIEEWWAKWPDAGIAIITGKISGIAAIDIDIHKGGKIEGLTPTITSRTGGGGQHCIYSYPSEGIGSYAGIVDHVDIRGDGGYIVVPPSLHESGRKYEWIVSPEDAKPEILPQIIFDLVKKQRINKPKDWEQIHKGVQEGQRNATATSYIGKVLQTTDPSMWEMSGWDAVCKWNDGNKPPLPYLELRRTWESIRGKRIKELLDNNPDNLKNLFRQSDKKKGIHELAKFLVEHDHIKTTDEKKREIYIYRGGIFLLWEKGIGAEIQKILEELTSNHIKKEIIERIKELTLTERDNFNADFRYINLENGVYDLEEKRLLRHSPEFLFLTKIPVIFDPDADCPKIKSFLSDILEPENIKIIQEWAGYILFRHYPIKKAIIFVGEPNTGKTTLISLLTRFVGEKDISGVSLQRISTDKFATSQLNSRYMNIFDDLSARDVNDNGIFKIATGGGYISGEYKFGNQFSFKNFAKLTFACNKIPNVADSYDEAYFSRWIIVRFDKEIETPNTSLLNDITAGGELSGLLNFALEGLNRLLFNQKFSYEKSVNEIKAEMLKSGSAIANFAYDCLKRSNNDWISKENMYKAFTEYIDLHNLPSTTIENFGKKLTRYADYAYSGKKDGKTGWRNVKLKIDEAVNDSNHGSFDESINNMSSTE